MRFVRPLLTFLTAGLILSAVAQPVAAAPNPDADPITGKPAQDSSVIEYVNEAYQFMAIIGGLLAVMMLIYAGYRYMTSYGDPENIKDAKDIVEKALIGLTLLILAALILNAVNPRTAQNPCNPGEPGCGTIDFSKPKGR